MLTDFFIKTLGAVIRNNVVGNTAIKIKLFNDNVDITDTLTTQQEWTFDSNFWQVNNGILSNSLTLDFGILQDNYSDNLTFQLNTLSDDHLIDITTTAAVNLTTSNTFTISPGSFNIEFSNIEVWLINKTLNALFKNTVNNNQTTYYLSLKNSSNVQIGSRLPLSANKFSIETVSENGFTELSYGESLFQIPVSDNQITKAEVYTSNTGGSLVTTFSPNIVSYLNVYQENVIDIVDGLTILFENSSTESFTLISSNSNSVLGLYFNNNLNDQGSLLALTGDNISYDYIVKLFRKCSGIFNSNTLSVPFNFPTDNITINIVFYLYSEGNNRNITFIEKAGVIKVYTLDNNLRIDMNGLNIFSSPITLNQTTWYHLYISKSTDSLTVRCSNINTSVPLSSHSITNNQNNLIINNSVNSLNGVINEISIEEGVSSYNPFSTTQVRYPYVYTELRDFVWESMTFTQWAQYFY